MKKTHIVASACVATALALYAFASSGKAAGGFVLLGSIFELMGWRKVPQAKRVNA